MGYRNPPAHGRFQKGQSGNFRGRTKGRHRRPPHEAVLGRLINMTLNGEEMTVTAAEEFNLLLAQEGLGGDVDAARQSLLGIAAAKSIGAELNPRPIKIVVNFVEPGSVSPALRPLRMATVLNATGPGAKTMIEPWLAQLALARLGERRLTPEQQAVVLQAVRTPGKVKWPSWWTVRP